MIFVTSDLHGRMDSLMKLLHHAHFFDSEENWLYILGDVIDRNDNGGIDILKWLLLQPNVQLLLGNHDEMLLANRWLFQEINDDTIDAIDMQNIQTLTLWQTNGAECTIQALSKEPPETRQDILEYLEECPLIECVNVEDTEYVLVHSGLGNYAKDKPLDAYTADELLWERPQMDTQYDPQAYTVIFGHTPTGLYGEDHQNRIIKTDSWWNIDTGAAMPNGRPMLLCLDTKKEFYLDEHDDVITV